PRDAPTSSRSRAAGQSTSRDRTRCRRSSCILHELSRTIQPPSCVGGLALVIWLQLPFLNESVVVGAEDLSVVLDSLGAEPEIGSSIVRIAQSRLRDRAKYSVILNPQRPLQ